MVARTTLVVARTTLVVARTTFAVARIRDVPALDGSRRIGVGSGTGQARPLRCRRVDLA